MVREICSSHTLTYFYYAQADGTAISSYTTTLLEETKGQDDEGVLGTAALIYSGMLSPIPKAAYAHFHRWT